MPAELHGPLAPRRRTPRALIAACGLLVLGVALACTTPFEIGERRYREGDPVAALEIWRAMGPDDFGYEQAQTRIAEVENEFDQLVVRYKQRARYFEEKGRLAESVLNYRLALRLQPEDRETLDHVQELVRRLARERAALRERLQTELDAGDLVAARSTVQELVSLDPFSPEANRDERQVKAALQAQIDAVLARGRRGFTSGNLNGAQRAFERVLVLDDRNESARGYLSYIEKIRTEEQRGSPVSQGPNELRSDMDASDAEIRAEGFFQNALAADRAGDPFAAIRFDLAALRADAQHPRARSHLGEVRRRLQPQVDPLVESGRRHYQSEDLQAALDDWRRALLIDPGNEQARTYAQRAERLLENLDRLRAEQPATRGGG